MLSADEHAPYNRPPLSKEYLRGESGEEVLALEEPSFYRENGIDLRLETTATGLDIDAKAVAVDGSEPVEFDVCVIATGCKPAPLPVEGATADGVLYLRSRSDAERLRSAAESARSAIVIGSGFIGCEAAASLSRREIDVTLVTDEELPQLRRLGEAVGERLRQWLESDGVALRLGAAVEKIEHARSVSIAGQGTVEADLVLVAGGIESQASIAEQAGLMVENDRILVDGRMRSSAREIWAAGDVAFAYNVAAGRHLVVEHWGEALTMGEIAGSNAGGEDASWEAVPGFWSDIGSRTLKYAAWGDGFDEARLVEHDGEAFTVWYERGGEAVGVLTFGADDDYEWGQTVIANHKAPPATEDAQPSRD